MAATGSRGEVLWEPAAGTIDRSRVGKYRDWLRDTTGQNFATYQALWQWSVDDLTGFWSSVWEYFGVSADGQPSSVLSGSGMQQSSWFEGTALNLAEHILRGDGEAIVVVAMSQTRERIELTRAELRDQVARVADGLRALGVDPGDRVVGYLPNIPEALVAMLATASIGAIWAACAPEFGAPGALARFAQLKPKVLIGVDGYAYGAKRVDRTAAFEQIRAGLPTLTAAVCVPYLGVRTGGMIPWSALLSGPATPVYLRVPFSHPLWVLFSSGSTGLPKAIVHSHGGIVLEKLKSHALQNDLGPGDRYFVFCTTTWVMWNILCSALIVGAGIVLMDGDPGYPDPAGLWRVTAETGATVLGCGAALLGRVTELDLASREIDLSALRAISATGSPLPAAVFRSIYARFGPVYLQSTSGGTDVCTGFVGGSPILPVRAGEMSGKCLAVSAYALDSDGRRVTGQPGELVIDKPMPSMPTSFWADPGGERYRAAYFDVYPGRWRHGDWIIFHDDGSCVITGRSDGTLNRGGVRLGSSEFYLALEAIPQVFDSLIVHLEEGNGVLGRLVLFIQLAPGAVLTDELRADIVARLRSSLSPRHAPDEVIAVPAIPYNLTGKKLEVPVKRLLKGESRARVVADGTLRDPSALDAIEALVPQFVHGTPTGSEEQRHE